MSVTLNRKQQQELHALLRRNDGVLTAHQVVSASRSSRSTLHCLIGWDRSDDELAAAYRLEKARLVLAALKLRQAEEDLKQSEEYQQRSRREQERIDQTLKVMQEAGARRTIHYDDDRDGGYRDVRLEILRGQEPRILAQLLRELRSWITSRSNLHAGFYAYMLEVAENVRQHFGVQENPNES